MHDLWLRLRAIFFKNRVEQDLDDELDFHIEMQKRKNIQSGMQEAEALRKARLQFGRDSGIKEECRDEQRIRPIETLRQDVSYALRGFRRTPTFALTVIATIGLGLGVNTALFTIFNAHVLRPLEVQDPSSLFQVNWLNRAGKEHQFSWPQYQQMRSNNPAFSDMHAVRGMQVRVDGRQCFAELVTGNYFRMLGVGSLLGRMLTPDDDGSVVVLSAAAWRKLYDSDPNIIGKKIRVRGFPLEVVGIARDGFGGLGDLPRDFWAPLSLYPRLMEGPDAFGPQAPELLYVIARLKPGLSLESAQSTLNAWAGRLTPSQPDETRATGFSLKSRATLIHLSAEAMLAILPIFIGFGLILLVACANVANMMLARAMARQREIGIRLSLGAARSRLIRQLLTESIVLALPGAAAGFLVSQVMIAGGIRLIYATLPPEFAEFFRIAPLEPDMRVFGFMMAAAIFSGIVFGFAPAMQATRPSVVQAARGDFGHEFRPQRLRNALVIVQIATSLMLLVCTGVLLQGANRVHTLDTGLETRDVVWVELFEKTRERVLSQLGREPLVRSLAVSSSVPLNSGFPSAKIAASPDRFIFSSYNGVSPEFFDVLNVPIQRGRNFTREESLSGAPVTVVSETVARRLWPNEDPVGKSLKLSADSRSHLAADNPLRFSAAQIIGVARDVNTGFLEDDNSRSLIYFPTNAQVAGTVLLLQVNGDPRQARQKIDKTLSEAVPGGVDRINRMQELIAGRVYPFRVAYGVSALLGILGLLLTISGIYGVISYLVEQRLREMGIRMALGATGRSVVVLVLKQSFRLAATGVLIGSAAALAASRLLASALVMIDTFDKTAYASAILAVLAACFTAAFVPSLRAARVDPVNTLRHD